MKKLVLTTYRTLLKSATKADTDFARRALVASAPRQIYDFYDHRWTDVDIEKEMPDNERTLDRTSRELNGGREWFMPPLQSTAAGGSIVRDMAVSNAVKAAFRRDPQTTQNLNLAFVAIKALGVVDSLGRSLPAVPLFPPTDFGFRIAPNGFADVTGSRNDDSPLAMLVAHPMMQGFFRHAILLVGDCGENGAVAVVVNKPLLNEHGQCIPVWSVVPDELHPLFSKHLKDNPVMVGGPIRGVDERQAGGGVFVVHKLRGIPGAMAVGQGVYFSGNTDAIYQALEDGKGTAKDVAVMLGYAGWGGGQLEGEVKRGSWFVAQGTNSEPVFQLSQCAEGGDDASPSPLARHPQESWVKFFGGLDPACAEMSRLGGVSAAPSGDDQDDQ